MSDEPQGESAARRWPRQLSAPRADAQGGGSEARTVREVAQRNPNRRRSAASAAGVTRSTATRRKASRSFSRPPRKGQRGGGLGHAGQREAHIERCTPSQLPAGSGTGERCPSDDEGRQRSVTCTVKAAPADEARAVRHARRREAPVPEELRRGLAVDAKATPRSSEPGTGRSKLAGANS